MSLSVLCGAGYQQANTRPVCWALQGKIDRIATYIFVNTQWSLNVKQGAY